MGGTSTLPGGRGTVPQEPRPSSTTDRPSCSKTPPGTTLKTIPSPAGVTFDNRAFARRCADSGIVFTVVPTNSYYRRTLSPERWALDHPIRHMPAAGIRIHPNTDDPTLHFVSPTQAWSMMVEDFGFGIEDLRSFMLNGLDAAWIDAGTRNAWRAEFLAAFEALRTGWPDDDAGPRAIRP